MKASSERIIGAIILIMILGGIGFFVGQYAPFTGGLTSIAEPFSPIRNQTAYGYAVVGGIIGMILGLMITPSKNKKGE